MKGASAVTMFDASIPTGKPVQLKQVIPGLWVAERPAEQRHYGFFDLLPVYAKKSDRPTPTQAGDMAGK